MSVAYMGSIVTVEPIENADRIERVDVYCGDGGTWSGVIKKGDFKPGDKCEVYVQDALVNPEDDRFEFLHAVPAKRRIRMKRLRGVPSECLVMHPTVEAKIGTDISEAVGATKYEKPIPAQLRGVTEGYFPAGVPKTNESNFQRVPEFLGALDGERYYITVKIDGTSSTAFFNDGKFGVCSRNYQLKESEGNVYWQMARQHKMEEVLPTLGNIAVQWETAGPGIQKNPLGLQRLTGFLFDAYDIDKQEYCDWADLKKIGQSLRMERAPLAMFGSEFDLTLDELRAIAEIKIKGVVREGIVVRPQKVMRVGNARLSFKVLNLEYKD